MRRSLAISAVILLVGGCPVARALSYNYDAWQPPVLDLGVVPRNVRVLPGSPEDDELVSESGAVRTVRWDSGRGITAVRGLLAADQTWRLMDDDHYSLLRMTTSNLVDRRAPSGGAPRGWSWEPLRLSLRWRSDVMAISFDPVIDDSPVLARVTITGLHEASGPAWIWAPPIVGPAGSIANQREVFRLGLDPSQHLDPALPVGGRYLTTDDAYGGPGLPPARVADGLHVEITWVDVAGHAGPTWGFDLPRDAPPLGWNPLPG